MIRPLERVLGESLAEHRWSTVLVFALGVLAMFITASGMYGVVALIVSRPTHEVGVAFDARREDVLALADQYAADTRTVPRSSPPWAPGDARGFTTGSTRDLRDAVRNTGRMGATAEIQAAQMVVMLK